MVRALRRLQHPPVLLIGLCQQAIIAGHQRCPPNRQRQLMQVIATLSPPSRFLRLLHRRQQQRDENPNDGNDDEQLYERKAGAL